MPNEQPSQRLVDLILWKLGLFNQLDTIQAEKEWQDLKRHQQYYFDVTKKVCEDIAKQTFGEILKRRLDGQTGRSPTDHELTEAFRRWGFANAVQLDQLRKWLGHALRPQATANSAANPATARTKVSYQGSPARAQNTQVPPTAQPQYPPGKPMKTPAIPVQTKPANFQPQPQQVAATTSPPNVSPPQPQNIVAPASENSVATEQATAPEAPAPIFSQWKYIKLPDDEPDPHTEFDAQTGRSPEQYEILGARVRGKKHKHDGTHCDDWFSFRNAGKWTVLAVSDGGGSYRFSRVGAKAACEAVTERLVEKLSNHVLDERDVRNFQEPDVVHVSDSLVDAVTAAWDAVKHAVEQRNANPIYENLLGRPLTTKDLYCTLLVTVHTTIRYQGAVRSLILGLAIGDGMMAAVDQSGGSTLLMIPDSGEHSGEVRFLDEREIEKKKLKQKVCLVVCNLRALLLMTDGVADDYFPNKPGMTWLYGDLVLNEILPVPPAAGGDMNAAFTGTTIRSASDLSPEEYVNEFEVLKLDPTPQKVRVRFISKLAEKLGLSAEEVVRRVALLDAFRGYSTDQRTRQARLQEWLDSYHVRGSFDDRTLLVMHR